MRIKFVLICILLCLAVLGPSQPGLADSSTQIPVDLLDHLQKQGWTQVSSGVMQRSLGGNRVETLGFGTAGLRFQIQGMKANLVFLRKAYARQPSRDLRVAIRSLRVKILRVQEALKTARATDGLELSTEDLIAPGPNCSANYDASAFAFPLPQGVGAHARTWFNNTCGYSGEVWAQAYAEARLADTTFVAKSQVDPVTAPNTPRFGGDISASAFVSLPEGVTDCLSRSYASVTNYDLGITYFQSDNADECVASLPAPWVKTDIGAVGPAGSASHVNGVFELIAGGTDLTGTADAFHFVHQTFTGDGTIVANVTALLKPAGATRTLAGVTFRNDLTAGSAHATMTITSEGEAQFRRRATAGGTTLSDGPGAGTVFAPQWLKLVRSGNVFTAYLSADGVTWTQVHTPQTVPMANTVQVGLVALRNGSSAPTGAARFEGVAVTVLPRPPVAVADEASTVQGSPVTIYVLANDSDPNGDPLTVQSVTQPGNGSVVILPGGGAVVYTPGTPPGASFSYTVSDGKGGTASANVTVTVLSPNTAPDARGDQRAVPYGLSAQIGGLLTNDFDADGHALTIASYNTAGLAGTLSCPPGANCTYTPPYGYRGVTSFTYTVSDGQGGTDTATVKLKVGVTQNPPVAVNDLFTTTRNVAKAFTIFDVLANDSDADGDVLNAQIGSGQRDYGSMSCTNPNYNCTYAPNAGFVGNDRFGYTVSDGADGSATAYIQMAVLPPAVPVLDAREDQRGTSQNQQLYIGYGGLLSNDYDPEGDPLTIASVDGTGLNGSLVCDTGGCLFRPASYFSGNTKFRYTASDGHGNSDTAIVRIRVGRPNTAAVTANDALVTKVNTPLRFSIFELMKNDYDAENDPLNVTVYPNAGRGTVSCGNPQYWCTYTPNANVTGADTFTYVLSDGLSYSAAATVNVTVTP